MGSSNSYSNISKDKNFVDYYDLIEKNLKKALNVNYNNINNQEISLKKSDFKNDTTNKFNKINNQELYFIPWKNHLIYYLMGFDYYWAERLLEFLRKNHFTNENKFESQIFYEEYKINTCPKVIIKINKDNQNIFDLIDDETLPNPFINLSNNLTGSLSSINSNNSNEYSVEDKKRRKEYCTIFKEQMYHEDHPIYIIIKQFISLFIEEIDKKIEYIKNQKIEDIKLLKNECNEIMEQIQSFVLEIQIVFKLFYSRTISLIDFKDEREEILNLITSVFFNVGNFYQKLYEFLFIINKNKILLFKEKIEILGNIEPEDLDIQEKFLLNNKTRKFQETLKQNKPRNIEDESNEINTSSNKLNLKLNIEEEQSNNNNHKYEDNELIVSSESSKLKRFINKFIFNRNKNDNKEPYEDAILFLKGINNYKTPFEKLIIIASVSSLITEAINEFWKDMKQYIEPTMLNIGSDDLTPIYIYILVKANLPELFIHCDFIKFFTCFSSKNTGVMGFYYNTVKGCLNYILELKDKSELKVNSHNQTQI